LKNAFDVLKTKKEEMKVKIIKILRIRLFVYVNTVG
jgi:hypothetical protein